MTRLLSTSSSHSTSRSRTVSSRHYFQSPRTPPARTTIGTRSKPQVGIGTNSSRHFLRPCNRDCMPNGMFERWGLRGIGSLDPHRSIPNPTPTQFHFFRRRQWWRWRSDSIDRWSAFPTTITPTLIKGKIEGGGDRHRQAVHFLKFEPILLHSNLHTPNPKSIHQPPNQIFITTRKLPASTIWKN